MNEKKSRLLTRLKRIINTPWFCNLFMLIAGTCVGMLGGDYESSTEMLLTYLFLRVGFSSPSGSPQE